jgi:hypothetical protein
VPDFPANKKMTTNERMNERIKQLAEQADFRLDELPDNILIPLEKFAKLIVRECMTNLYLNGYDDAVIQIQKHFGVEQ